MLRLIRASLLSVALLFMVACDGHAQSLPACVAQQLKDMPGNKMYPTSVETFIYKGKKVFAFGADCPDCGSTIMDEQCTPICGLGGLSGKGDGKCPDFDKLAKKYQ